MTKHARLGPSNHRWPHCPGSVREEKKYPYEGSSAPAIDGTGSHELLELCLNNNVPAIQYDQQIIAVNHRDQPNGWLVDAERCGRVQICLDYVTRRIAELREQFPDCVVKVDSETLSNPGSFFDRDDWWGTVDITITASSIDGSKIYFVETIDYKDGRGYVTEKWNTQLISYLYGKIALYITKTVGEPSMVADYSGCRMTIVQPKTGTPIRYMCSTRPDDSINFLNIASKATELAFAADATDEPDAPLIPGKHCQWCKHNPKRGGSCTAETDKSTEVIRTMSDKLVTTSNDGLLDMISNAVADVKSLSVAELTMIADAEDGFSAAFNKVRSEIQERIETGETVPGFAMLPGKCSRVWNESEEVIAKTLKARRLKKDEIYPSKLISVAQALKHPSLTDTQKKKIEKDLVSEVAGKMSLKKVSYDHKAEKQVDQMFADVPTVEENNEVKSEVSFL